MGRSRYENRKWTGIIGYWKVPAVSEPAEPQGTEGGWNSSSWLGLDGFFFSNDVLQAGIQQKVILLPPFNIPIPIYVAWYEWHAPAQAGSPNYIYQTNIANFPVKPGDQVFCSVQYNGTTSGAVSFANETTGQHFSITLAPPPGASFNGQSCEWIMEAPDEDRRFRHRLFQGMFEKNIPTFNPGWDGNAHKLSADVRKLQRELKRWRANDERSCGNEKRWPEIRTG